MDVFNHLKFEKALWPSEVYEEMILGCDDVGIGVLMELC